jgi:hypothetical protein
MRVVHGHFWYIIKKSPLLQTWRESNLSLDWLARNFFAHPYLLLTTEMSFSHLMSAGSSQSTAYLAWIVVLRYMQIQFTVLWNTVQKWNTVFNRNHSQTHTILLYSILNRGNATECFAESILRVQCHVKQTSWYRNKITSYRIGAIHKERHVLPNEKLHNISDWLEASLKKSLSLFVLRCELT